LRWCVYSQKYVRNRLKDQKAIVHEFDSKQSKFDGKIKISQFLARTGMQMTKINFFRITHKISVQRMSKWSRRFWRNKTVTWFLWLMNIWILIIAFKIYKFSFAFSNFRDKVIVFDVETEKSNLSFKISSAR